MWGGQSIGLGTTTLWAGAYKLEDVARSICSSSALAVEEPNQLAMVGGGRLDDVGRERCVWLVSV